MQIQKESSDTMNRVLRLATSRTFAVTSLQRSHSASARYFVQRPAGRYTFDHRIDVRPNLGREIIERGRGDFLDIHAGICESSPDFDQGGARLSLKEWWFPREC